MDKQNIKRSPLFYVGDKYKLISQIKKYIPNSIENYYEPFLGGGSMFLNIKADRYFLNDIDTYLIDIHKYLYNCSENSENFFSKMEKIVEKYDLSRSYKEDIIPPTLKKEWKKTYFAKFNKKSYEKLRTDFNRQKEKNPVMMYLLLIYGFNRMLRFNKEGKFNIPVGNVDLNKNVIKALEGYFGMVKKQQIKYYKQDYKSFLNENRFSPNDFTYFDPPYLSTFSEYNKLWNKKNEEELLSIIDNLNQRKVRFAMSNVTHYNGSRNDILLKWIKKYNVYTIKSNYISYFDNSHKKIKEILVTNYE